VEGQNYLGIYLSKASATAVCLSARSRDKKILDCFSVAVEKEQSSDTAEQSDIGRLINLIAQRCAQKQALYQNCEVVVSLDCGMYMQHSVHSAFADPKQIYTTVRFDTEETLAMDIGRFAISFSTVSSNRNGSELTVFTTDKQVLSEIILCLQSKNLDPVGIEPDANSLSRFIRDNIAAGRSFESDTVFCVFSEHSGYFIFPLHSRGTEKQSPTLSQGMRTFILGPSQDKNELLGREFPVVAALAATGGQLRKLKVFDAGGSVNFNQLSGKMAVEVQPLQLTDAVVTAPDEFGDCAGQVDFAIACGAAGSGADRQYAINFRHDFMPYQGRKMRLQKALKLLGVCLMVLVIAASIYFQVRLFRENRPRRRLRDKFAKEYAAVMLGKKPPAGPVRKLMSEKRRIENVKSGQLSVTGEESVAAKLTLILGAFNNCAAETRLNIESISVTTKTVRIVGQTSSRKNTLKLRRAIEENGLKILQDQLVPERGHDSFIMTVVPKK